MTNNVHSKRFYRGADLGSGIVHDFTVINHKMYMSNIRVESRASVGFSYDVGNGKGIGYGCSATPWYAKRRVGRHLLLKPVEILMEEAHA